MPQHTLWRTSDRLKDNLKNETSRTASLFTPVPGALVVTSVTYQHGILDKDWLTMIISDENIRKSLKHLPVDMRDDILTKAAQAADQVIAAKLFGPPSRKRR